MKNLLVALLFALLVPVTAHAADARVQQAENWLGSLKTAQARFTQRGFDGQVLNGTFYISRPGKLRFEYDAPTKDFVVADGVLIHFYDGQQKQASSAPIGTTLADFLLRKSAKLSGDLKVVSVKETTDETLITLTQAADASAGSILLRFAKTPFALKSWRIIDPQGYTTDITLSNLREGVSLPASLFVFKDPSGRNRLND